MLDELPFQSKKKGRMTAWMKQKSMIRTERKPKITYDVHASLKRPNNMVNLNLSQVQPQASAPSQSQQTPTGIKKIQPTIISTDVNMGETNKGDGTNNDD